MHLIERVSIEGVQASETGEFPARARHAAGVRARQRPHRRPSRVRRPDVADGRAGCGCATAGRRCWPRRSSPRSRRSAASSRWSMRARMRRQPTKYAEQLRGVVERHRRGQAVPDVRRASRDRPTCSVRSTIRCRTLETSLKGMRVRRPRRRSASDAVVGDSHREEGGGRRVSRAIGLRRRARRSSSTTRPMNAGSAHHACRRNKPHTADEHRQHRRGGHHGLVEPWVVPGPCTPSRPTAAANAVIAATVPTPNAPI